MNRLGGGNEEGEVKKRSSKGGNFDMKNRVKKERALTKKAGKKEKVE